MMKFLKEVKFNDEGLVPAIIQDTETGEVLMLAYMNKEALHKTITVGRTVFWSRSRNRLWLKGETSGNYQQVREIRLDCDGDTLLIEVEQTGVACHTGEKSCFFRQIEEGQLKKTETGKPIWTREASAAILQRLFEVVLDRKQNPKTGSYTCALFDGGREKMLKKIGEEASEVIIAAMDEDRPQIIYESADLIYHLLVVLGFHDIPLEAVYEELERRYKG